jgi:hypothetical protein
MTIILDRLTTLSTKALGFVACDKAEATARQWLGSDSTSIESLRWLVASSLAWNWR